MYALGALLAVRIESVIGKEYEPSHAVGRSPSYVESIIALNAEFEEEAIDILNIVNSWKIMETKGSYDTITELETEYTRGLGEEFLPEHKMR